MNENEITNRLSQIEKRLNEMGNNIPRMSPNNRAEYMRLIEEKSNLGGQLAKLQREQKSANWQNDPATDAQYNYLARLGVNVTRKLSKGEASTIINAVKRGEGCGSFGLSFMDGSN